jgi:transcriptional regulator with XRE-family HTH domain
MGRNMILEKVFEVYSDELRYRLRNILSKEPLTYLQIESESGVSRYILSKFLNNVCKADVHIKTRCKIEKYIINKEKELGIK